MPAIDLDLKAIPTQLAKLAEKLGELGRHL